MRDLGTLWQRFQADRKGEWVYERRIIVDGDPYHEIEIYDFSKNSGLIPTTGDMAVGRAESATFNVTLLGHKSANEIPRYAKVEIQLRIVQVQRLAFAESSGKLLYDRFGNQLIANYEITDWKTFGTYYASRRWNEERRLFLECFDAMRFAEEQFLIDGEILDDYPMSASKALQRISDALNIPLDQRNHIRDDVYIDYPNDLSMREVLGFIASAHSGNFIITDEEKLRLVIAKNEPPLFSLTHGQIKNKTTGKTRIFDKLYVTFTDNGDYFEAGNGQTSIDIYNIFATQEMTNRIYNEINSYVYNTFDATSVDIDPALELGDSIEINGVQCNLWTMAWTSRLFCDIKAPTKGDTDQEFEFAGTLNKTIQRKVSLNTKYYGTSISKLKGLHIFREDNTSEMTMNSDAWEVKTNGERALYIDYTSSPRQLIFNGILGGEVHLDQTQIDGLSSTISNLQMSFELGLNNLKYDVQQSHYTKEDINNIITTTETNLKSSFNTGLDGLKYTLQNDYTQKINDTNINIKDTENRLTASFNVGLDNLNYNIHQDFYTKTAVDNLITTTTNTLTSSFNAGIDGLNYTLQQNYFTKTEIDGKITTTESTLRSEIKAGLENISLSVSNGTTSSTLTLKSGETILSSENITFEGFVTFTDLSGVGGTTIINGGNLTTNSVTAEKIYVTTLASISTDIGNVTAGNIPATLITSGTLNDARLSSNVVLLNNSQTITGNKTFSGTTYFTGNISANGQTVTPTNLSYVAGATSNIQYQLNNIQTQLNSKQATITGAATTIVSNNLTSNRAVIANSSGKIDVSSVTTTELGYLSGVTSNIQTQLNSKMSSSGTVTSTRFDLSSYGSLYITNFLGSNTVTLQNYLGSSGLFIYAASGKIELLCGSHYLDIASSGISIGTSSTQRVGFYGTTPVAKQAGWSNLSSSATLASVITQLNNVTTFFRTMGLTT